MMFCTFFKYFLIVDKLRSLTGLFIVMMIPLVLKRIKSATMFELEFFKHLLTLVV